MCVIEVFQYSNFEQIAEFSARIGSLTKYAQVVKDVINYIFSKVEKRFYVGIENNSMGVAIVESLENDNSFDYIQYLYREDPKKPYGIATTSKSKDKMISIFYDYITSEPTLLHSGDLITQLSIIEKKSNGSISAQFGQHDDLFMASCFCALVKKDMMLDIEPFINKNSKKINEQQDKIIQSLINLNSREDGFDRFSYIKEKNNKEDIPFPEMF